MLLISFETFIHLLAGGVGGTIGAVVTCPLEVVKTRLQSSVANFNTSAIAATSAHTPEAPFTASASSSKNTVLLWRYFKHIIDTEGSKALLKGLGPNLIGVAPSRAIYFCTYSSIKELCNEKCSSPDSPLVHVISAASAGFVSCTATNPIWFVKTRLQLDQSKYGSTTAWSCIKSIYRQSGFIGFYKGITASYFGISETIIHFVIYEFIKSKLRERRVLSVRDDSERATTYFFQYMAAGAVSKTIASILAYPHEVARTRLRQEGKKYRNFTQTIFLVWKEEGVKNGLYRGLSTQLLRQIPNTAIMMATYEVIVNLMKSLLASDSGL